MKKGHKKVLRKLKCFSSIYNVFFIRMSLTVLKTLWNFILAYTITKHLKMMLLLKTMLLRFFKSVNCIQFLFVKNTLFSRPVFCGSLTWRNLKGLAELAYLRVMYFYENQIYTFQYFRRSGLTLKVVGPHNICLLYTSPSPRDGLLSRMPSSA